MNAARPPEQLLLLPFLLKWLLLALLVAALSGSASALFLSGLDWATRTREAHPWLLLSLPLTGVSMSWLYLWFGQSVEAGNNLLIDEIHDPRRIVPLRMAPLIMLATIASHLSGASVGREGTAVQMGGALADQLTRAFDLHHDDRRLVLMAGISAGFASVFGTPLAGAIFGLEVLAFGRMRYDAILPCLLAALLADQVSRWWGVQHVHYAVGSVPPLSVASLAAMLCAGALFGLAGKLFADGSHVLSAWLRRRIAYAPWRPLLGSAGLIAVVWSVPATQAYLGLGVPGMQRAFLHPVAAWDWLGKGLFTAWSLGTGFKGGEVTPLFFIGATLGNALSGLLHLPFALLAGVGMVAVFAGAANTPIASTFMAMELFGAEIGGYAALGCVMAYLFSGHSGIYRAQRVGRGKHGSAPDGVRLGELAAHPGTATGAEHGPDTHQ